MNKFIHKYGKPDVHFDSNSISESELANNQSLQPHHIDKLIDKDDTDVHRNLANNQSLQPHHIDKLIDKENSHVNRNLASNPSIQTHHIDTLIDKGDVVIHWNLAKNPSLQPHHIDTLIDKWNRFNERLNHRLKERQDLTSEQRARLK